MAAAQGYIPFSENDPSGFKVPTGLSQTTTPQGGSAYTDTAGTYGVKGATYLKQSNGYFLAPQTLPGNNMQAPTAGQGLNPVANAAPTNVPVQPAGTTILQAPTVMPSTVKTALETAANAGGNNIGSGVPVNPSKTPAPTIDYTVHQGETLDQYNARVAQEQQAAGVTPSNPSSPSSSLPNINDYVSALGAAPTPPNLATDQTTAENNAGIPAIQTNITNVQSQIDALQATIQQNEAQEAGKSGVVASIINGRMTMVSKDNAYALAQLNSQLKTAQTQLTNANTAVSVFMKNEQTDYRNASAAYEKAYTEAVTQYNDAVSQQDKQQTAAKANAQVIINSYKGSTAGTGSITQDEVSQWNTIEMQAGLPVGTIQAAVQNEMNITKFVKGSDGYTYVTGIDANGNPYTAKVEGSYGSGSGKAGTNNDPNKVIADFQKSLGVAPSKGVTREQFIRQLQAKYPNIDPSDISAAVYKTYPDGWDTRSSTSQTSSFN